MYEIAARHELVMMNVFHAGDGNLHPLIVFDRRTPGVMERVMAAGDEIITACVEAGGVLSGEHGIGLEKRDYMPLLFSAADLDAQARLRDVFDPDGVSNPTKVLPAGSRCGDLQRSRGCMDLTSFVEEVGTEGPVTAVGGRTQWHVGGAVAADAREVRAPEGIVEYEPAEMTVRCGAATTVREVDEVVGAHGQLVALPDAEGATVGGVLAVGRSGIRRLGYGPVRDVLLEARYVSAEGLLIKAGGPTVKNVSGFDLCRLLVGSLGTIGLLGEVRLRCRPRPARSQWYAGEVDPFALHRELYRPISILWDGTTTWVLLEGHPVDVDDQARGAAAGAGRRAAARADRRSPVAAPGRAAGADGEFVAEIGVGVVHLPTRSTVPVPGVPDLHRRIKAAFDPTGRLNPGRTV